MKNCKKAHQHFSKDLDEGLSISSLTIIFLSNNEGCQWKFDQDWICFYHTIRSTEIQNQFHWPIDLYRKQPQCHKVLQYWIYCRTWSDHKHTYIWYYLVSLLRSGLIFHRRKWTLKEVPWTYIPFFMPF